MPALAPEELTLELHAPASVEKTQTVKLRSGGRMQPTAQAVGGTWEMPKPRRGGREAMTQTLKASPFTPYGVHSSAWKVTPLITHYGPGRHYLLFR
jgi:hypothetical protein